MNECEAGLAQRGRYCRLAANNKHTEMRMRSQIRRWEILNFISFYLYVSLISLSY